MWERLWILSMSTQRQFMYKICQYENRPEKNYKCAMIDFYFVGHCLSLLTIVSDIAVSGKISWSIRLSLLCIKFHRQNWLIVCKIVCSLLSTNRIIDHRNSYLQLVIYTWHLRKYGHRNVHDILNNIIMLFHFVMVCAIYIMSAVAHDLFHHRPQKLAPVQRVTSHGDIWHIPGVQQSLMGRGNISHYITTFILV